MRMLFALSASSLGLCDAHDARIRGIVCFATRARRFLYRLFEARARIPGDPPQHFLPAAGGALAMNGDFHRKPARPAFWAMQRRPAAARVARVAGGRWGWGGLEGFGWSV